MNSVSTDPLTEDRAELQLRSWRLKSNVCPSSCVHVPPAPPRKQTLSGVSSALVSVAPLAAACPHVGNYRLLKTVGKGNFAKVKLARHTPTGRQVSGSQVTCVHRTTLRTSPHELMFVPSSEVISWY
uniref:Protein kinase domain-containing protein n=1 Tax=Mola mola TaxID=94237 RepID=A0A3Q3XER1_MOLML